MDQRMSCYSRKPKFRKYTIVAVSYLLDACRVNASTIMALNTSDKELKSFNFGLDLVLALVRPYIKKRSRNGLKNDIVKKIKFVLGSKTSA